MTQLKYSVPSVGERNTVAEPKVDVALNEIKTVVNGELDNENLKAGGVAKSNLSAELKAELSSFVGLPLEARKSITATEQERASAVFGTLPTPDEVEVTLPENGLIAIAYQAAWSESVKGAGQAEIFLAGNAIAAANGPSTTVAAVPASVNNAVAGKFSPLSTWPVGLVSLSSTGSIAAASTLGQVVGQYSGLEVFGGPCYVFAAAGTYKISVRFKASSGSVKVKERKLWAWIIG